MNLLLEALKKQNPSGLTPDATVANSSHAPSPQEGDSGTAKATLARKNPDAKKRLQLGIAFITGGVVASGISYFAHIDADPPRARTTQYPPTHSASSPPEPIAAHLPAAASAPLPTHALSRAKPESATTPAANDRSKRGAMQQEPPPDISIRQQQEPDSIDLLLSAAYASYQKGELASAWQQYSVVIGKVPNNRDALLGLAVIEQQQGKDDAALDHYRIVLQLDPRDPVAHAGLSRFGGGSPASKESRLAQLIAQQPDSAALYFALGHQYAEQSRWSDARQAYFSALAMEPGNALFAFNLAISLDHLGQRGAAASFYRQAIQLSHSDSPGFSREQARSRLDELTAQDK